MNDYMRNKFIITDMNEIEKVLENNVTDVDLLKKLHRKIDNKYQSMIKNWGKSMWAWSDEFGFNYEFLGKESLIDNLESMLYKLSGLVMNSNYDFAGQTKINATSINAIEITNSLKNESKRVFIVHGRDAEKKYEISHFLREQGLEPIILHEQVNKGQTIIEKIESYGEVACAIILLTPDDEGRLKDSDDKLKTRARQNVIFEAGYFMGRLGRERTILLSGVEEDMSDINGIVCLDINNYKYDLLKELKFINLIK